MNLIDKGAMNGPPLQPRKNNDHGSNSEFVTINSEKFDLFTPFVSFSSIPCQAMLPHLRLSSCLFLP